MKTCEAMRSASLRGANAWTARTTGIEAASRAFCVVPLLRGLHDGIGKTLEVVQWLQKGPLAPGTASSRGQRPVSRDARCEFIFLLSSPFARLTLSDTRVQRFQTSSMSKSWHVSPPTLPNAYPDSKVSLTEQLRAVMRLLPHSVVVCTSTRDAALRAMTMSSFTSLTLEPSPLVTFNVKTPSRTLEAIAASQRFNIHVLAGTPAGAALADHFTKGNLGDDVLFQGLQDVTCEKPVGEEPPVLKGEAVLYVLRCKLMYDAPMHGLMRVRDHVIVAGEVVQMIPGSGEREFGLVYGDRRYRGVGGVISNEE